MNLAHRLCCASILATSLPLFAGCLASTEDAESAAIGSAPSASTSPNAAFLWRGFNHWWEYNHRVNRLGDWVGNVGWSGGAFIADAFHTAASGSGPDTATFNAWATAISTPSAAFQAGSTTLHLKGARSALISSLSTISVTPGASMWGRGKQVVVLEGFDVQSNNDADKLIAFDLAVSNARESAGKLAFDLGADMQMDCTSAECGFLGIGADDVDYNVTVHYLLIAGDGDFRHTPTDHASTYGWDTTTEAKLLPSHRFAQTVDGPSGYAAAALGYTSFKVRLQAEEHLLALTLGAPSSSYTPSTGLFSFDQNEFFKNWAVGMTDTNPPDSWLSYAAAGTATIEMGAELLQFKSGTATVVTTSGSWFYDASASAVSLQETTLGFVP